MTRAGSLALVFLVLSAPALAQYGGGAGGGGGRPGAGGGGRGTPNHSEHPNERLFGRATALEGDLLSIGGEEVRIMGIDAPEPGQMCKNKYGSRYDCFAIARGVLKAMIGTADVECTIAERDRNSQKKGECRVRGIDLGAAMVARGWAFAFRSLTPVYQQSEAYAQSKKLGMWAGQVEKPWEWRSRQLRETAR